MPPRERVVTDMLCPYMSNTCGRQSGPMPWPLSQTSTRICPWSAARHTSMRPPAGVNLTALLSKFRTTCSMRTTSAITYRPSASLTTSIVSSRAAGSARSTSAMPATTWPSATGAIDSESLPVRTRDMSNRSSMIFAWLITALRMTAAARMVAGERRISGMRDNSSTLMLIMFSGWRSSCDITDKNSSFSAAALCASLRTAASRSDAACSRSSPLRSRRVTSRAIFA